MMIHKQPAMLSYFFHDGFVDLWHILKDAFKRCGGNISENAAQVKNTCGKFKMPSIFKHEVLEIFKSLPTIWRLGYFLAQFLFSVTIAPLTYVIITVSLLGMLLILFSIFSIVIGIVILSDRIFCSVNAIVSHCPNCQSKFNLPVYICPGHPDPKDSNIFKHCGIEHDRLRPGVYGILNRICDCGKKLPTTFMNGRHRLDAKCPHCGHNIKDGGLHASWCIPVVGGPGSGKTCYINMMMMSLEKNAYSEYGLRFEHEKNGLDEYEANAAGLSCGHLPEKTQELRLRYYQFTLTPDNVTKQTTKQQISLCDVAGELFDIRAGSKEIVEQIGFRYANAIMLLIDPLSIPEYCKEISNVINLNSYRRGAQSIEEMLDTFVRTLQNMFSIEAKAMLNTDVAVVFTKGDIPGLDEEIGEGAVLESAPNFSLKHRYKTQNKLCEDFLRRYGEDNFLINLKSRFKSVQFFICSALGHVENGQPFAAKNVEEPFFWLIRKKSAVIDKTIKTRGGDKC
jgi:GTPase SAR1 family protein